MTQRITEAVKKAVKSSYGVDPEVSLTRPDPTFGDYSTNVALTLAKSLSNHPDVIAETIISKLDIGNFIKSIDVKSGFINFWLSDQALGSELDKSIVLPESGKDKLVLVEFGDPNPFKDMHIGHLYSSIVGDSISGLFESHSFQVKRLSYHGDVGLQVAKWIYGVGSGINFDPSKLEKALGSAGDEPLGYFYALGEKAYISSEEAATEIKSINQHVYEQDDSNINEIYKLGKQLSFKEFNKIFELLGIKYDKRYLESETASVGKKLVEENVGKVFQKSQGAIVYVGEAEGLHTRVFITSKGLPTYESKDLGLTVAKERDFPNTDKSIIITAMEQSEYFAVMLSALAKIKPELARKTTHLSHGFLSLKSGKMSSREGNVYGAKNLIDEVKEAIEARYADSPAKSEIYLSALRYEFLKHKLGSDIVFDVGGSISLEGNSGPYILYAHARAISILSKSSKKFDTSTYEFDPAERKLAVAITKFPETVDKALEELKPHTICNYLFELAGEFNTFYESNRVIGDKNEAIRVKLVGAYAEVLKAGLGILNIPSPSRM